MVLPAFLVPTVCRMRPAFSRPPVPGSAEKGIRVLSSATSEPQPDNWLIENGPRELELLFRAIVFQPSTPILLADDQRHYREASVGASLLLGLRREEIIGRSLDDFAEPSVKPVIPELWQDFLKDGEQAGTLRLRGADGAAREVEYTAKSNVLPVRHVLVLRDKGAASQSGASDENSPGGDPPKWVQDFALFLLS